MIFQKVASRPSQAAAHTSIVHTHFDEAALSGLGRGLVFDSVSVMSADSLDGRVR